MKESVIYQDIVAEAIAKGKAEGKAEGIQEGEVILILRLLKHRLGEIDSELENRIYHLSILQLEQLAEALLDFAEINDLVGWLERQ